MSRITDGILPDDRTLRLTLDRYQEIMRLPINAFNGVNLPTEEPQYECSTIWKQSERDYLAEHLSQAEEKREQELGYNLAPVYLADEEYEYSIPIILEDKYLVSIGVETSADVSLGASIDHGPASPSENDPPNDPVEITIATTLTDASQIKVYYPDESVEIRPSSVSISGGTLTIKIPRARLVKPSLNDNREDHLDYYDNDNFLSTVDVKRVYYVNTGSAVSFVWDRFLTSGISEQTQVAWNRIIDRRLSIIDLRPATYSDGWKAAVWKYVVDPDRIKVSYISGRKSSMNTEMLTARFAHTLMPNKPVSCPTVHMYWDEDRETNEAGIVTPYGNSNGALNAWLADSRAKVGVGGKFPRAQPLSSSF